MPMEMRSPTLQAHFRLIQSQRTAIYERLAGCSREELWAPLAPGKWSRGEHLAHLARTLELIRKIARIAIPLLTPFAWLFRNRPFERHSPDVYAEYEQKHGRPMKAPSLIVPARRPEMDLDPLRAELQRQTVKLEALLVRVPEEIAGHIRFLDPPGHNPNLIQAVHILAIHEAHHFKAMFP